MSSYSRFVISKDKVSTLLYWKNGEVRFYRKNDKNDEGFEMQGLVPWQRTVKEELEIHFGYPPSSVSFRVVMKQDKEGHNTYFMCPHKISNKLMWKDLQLFQDLVTYVSLKCASCVAQLAHKRSDRSQGRSPKHEPVKERRLKRKPARVRTSLYSARDRLNNPDIPRAPVAPQTSPEEFMSSIAEECDNFKKKIMSKISDYFKASTVPSNDDSDSDENYFEQTPTETVVIKNEPAERTSSISFSSSQNPRPRRAKKSNNAFRSWADSSNEDEYEVDVKYENNMR